MARTKSKPKSARYSVRSVRSKEDRRRPSVFFRLKTDEAFKGIALFEPDPELEDNPGYFEYYDHYDNQANQYVPCAGDKCPFCAANDNPSTRALTVWYFPEEGNAADQIKVFTMNYSTINDISDEAEEEEGILGRKVRIKRLSDKGDYKVRVLSDKPLIKKDLKVALKALAEKFPDGLEKLVTDQLKRQMERLRALDALEDDDEDDEEEEDEAITDQEYEVVKVQEKDEIFDLKNDDGKVKMWLGEGIDVDYGEVKKGVLVKLSAEKDEEGDWIITALELAKKRRGRPKGSQNKKK